MRSVDEIALILEKKRIKDEYKKAGENGMEKIASDVFRFNRTVKNSKLPTKMKESLFIKAEDFQLWDKRKNLPSKPPQYETQLRSLLEDTDDESVELFDYDESIKENVSTASPNKIPKTSFTRVMTDRDEKDKALMIIKTCIENYLDGKTINFPFSKKADFREPMKKMNVSLEHLQQQDPTEFIKKIIMLVAYYKKPINDKDPMIQTVQALIKDSSTRPYAVAALKFTDLGKQIATAKNLEKCPHLKEAVAVVLSEQAPKMGGMRRG